jgi:limonene-1,2-epoxide hydrolase
VTPPAEVALQRLEADREVLVERGDGDVARGAEEWEVDVSAVAEVEDRRRVKEDEISPKGGEGWNRGLR